MTQPSCPACNRPYLISDMIAWMKPDTEHLFSPASSGSIHVLVSRIRGRYPKRIYEVIKAGDGALVKRGKDRK